MTKLNEIKKIGFIGAGVMGEPMAQHLIEAGFDLNIYTRTQQRAENLIANGAKWCNSPYKCAQDCDLVISIVGYPEDVKEVWLSRNGALAGMKANAIGMDMTTSSPDLAVEIFNVAQSKQIHMVDCPVTGGDIGAKNKTLTMLYGGEASIFGKLEPVFMALGKKAVNFGEAGKGQLAKACNQIAVASTMFSVCESIVFAERMGLDAKLAIETLNGGAASSFSLGSYGPRILQQDYAPGFKIEHFVKDMEIALKVCHDRAISLPGLELAKKSYALLKEMGHGSKGTQALYLFYNSAEILPALMEITKEQSEANSNNK